MPAARLADDGTCGKCRAKLPALDAPLDVDAATFDEIVKQSKVPVLVDFWADWCAPCHALDEVLERSNDLLHPVRVARLDLDHSDLVAEQQQLLRVDFEAYDNFEVNFCCSCGGCHLKQRQYSTRFMYA